MHGEQKAPVEDRGRGPRRRSGRAHPTKKVKGPKIKCAKKLFNEISTDDVVYGQVDSYQNLLSTMNAI
jgi:hypothetical protein